MVNNLLVHGTDPELTDACDMTSLMVVLENRHEATGEVLMAPTIAAGALDVQDSDGKSVLMWASARDQDRAKISKREGTLSVCSLLQIM